jgi:uncharacterized protein with HEPN domain
MNRDKLYVKHILECIARVEENVAGGEAAFRQNHIIQDAVLRNLQVLSESVKRLSEATKLSQPSIDWGKIAKFRNIVVHDYLHIDFDIVWGIIEHDLSPLKTAVQKIQESIP